MQFRSTSDVLISVGATDADRATVDSPIKKFDAFFDDRRNVIYESARFNLRTQQPGESAEQFIIALSELLSIIITNYHNYSIRVV